jgi:hypothetical protein
MEQITIKIDGETLERMKARMAKNGCKTLSQCARELIDLGLRVEEAASSQEGGDDANDLSPALTELVKTNMTWLLETRFLVRFLVENLKDIEPGNSRDFIEKAKERAVVAVDDLIKIKKVSD